MRTLRSRNAIVWALLLSSGGINIALGEPWAWDNFPENWLSLADAVITGTVRITKEMPVRFSRDQGGAPFAWKVEAEFDRIETLYGKDSPKTVAFVAERWDHASHKTSEDRALNCLAEAGGRPKAIFVVFLRRVAEAWNIFRVLPGDGPDDPLIDGVRTIIELETRTPPDRLATVLVPLVETGHPLVVREYAVRKIMCLDAVLAEERVAIISSAVRSAAARRERRFSLSALGVMGHYLRKGSLGQRGDEVALDTILNLLKGTSDPHIAESCISGLALLSGFVGRRDALRAKVYATLKATPNLPKLPTEQKGGFNQADYRSERARLLRRYAHERDAPVGKGGQRASEAR